MTEEIEIQVAKVVEATSTMKEDVSWMRKNMATREFVNLSLAGIKSKLSVHQALIIAIIIGIVSLGLWTLRVGITP